MKISHCAYLSTDHAFQYVHSIFVVQGFVNPMAGIKIFVGLDTFFRFRLMVHHKILGFEVIITVFEVLIGSHRRNGIVVTSKIRG